MTPRQLMALSKAHREFEAHREGRTPDTPTRQSGRVNGQGSAGWLIAVAGSLDRSRAAHKRRPVATIPAPGVG